MTKVLLERADPTLGTELWVWDSENSVSDFGPCIRAARRHRGPCDPNLRRGESDLGTDGHRIGLAPHHVQRHSCPVARDRDDRRR